MKTETTAFHCIYKYSLPWNSYKLSDYTKPMNTFMILYAPYTQNSNFIKQREREKGILKWKHFDHTHRQH